MTSDNPYSAAGPGGPGGPGGPEGPRTEYLGDASSAQPGRPRRRRPLLLAAAAVAVVGVAGGAAWGVAQLVGGGAEPAAAVPADALAYLAVDLDPSAAQKVEAFRTLRKFPALKEKLDLGSRDDVREWVFEKIRAEGQCEDLTFDDVDSWLGYRMGVAVLPAVDTGKDPDPVVVVQVDDEDAAREGTDDLFACADNADDRPGRAFVDDYMVLAETQETADRAAADASSSSLADDADFQRWMGEAGDPGIITGYVSAGITDAIADQVESGSTDDWLATPGLARSASFAAAEALSSSDAPSSSDRAEELRAALADFEGAAAVVRFADGAVEAEVVAQGLPGQDVTSTGDSGIERLPASTVVALGVSLGDGWADRLVDQLRTSMGDQADVDQMLARIESETGLELPGDAERLLGDGVSLAVDSGIDVSALAGGSPDPTGLALGLRITGDPDEITPVLDKLTALLGPWAGEALVVEEGDGAVAVGVDPDYVKTLAGDGGLGDEDRFTRVVPEAGSAGGALFVDVDEGGWLDDLLAEVDDPDAQQAKDNLKPLAAVGASGWTDGDVAHGLLTITTD